MEIVKVVNTSRSKPLVLKHDGQGDIIIGKGKERIVPLEYATLSFGNPGARNEGRNKVRDTEYANMRTRHGFYPGMMSEDVWLNGGTLADGTHVDRRCPEFEVYDMDGERIYMLLDDPLGLHAAENKGLNLASGDDNTAVAQRIASLEGQIAQLMQMVAAQAPQTEVPVPKSQEEKSEEKQAAGGGKGSGDADEDEDSGNAGDAPESQEKRNEQRDDLPKPKPGTVKKDGPTTGRVGPNA